MPPSGYNHTEKDFGGSDNNGSFNQNGTFNN
jgi:hypothetical protein